MPVGWSGVFTTQVVDIPGNFIDSEWDPEVPASNVQTFDCGMVCCGEPIWHSLNATRVVG